MIAYSDPKAGGRTISGMLDDYAFTIIACIEAYESTASIEYFNSARAIADAMIKRFFDATGGGFFDMDSTADPTGLLGALSARRNRKSSAAAIARKSRRIDATVRSVQSRLSGG